MPKQALLYPTTFHHHHPALFVFFSLSLEQTLIQVQMLNSQGMQWT